ncbi:MAG: YgaP-like transmembrane domain [Desulfomonilia bacterium]
MEQNVGLIDRVARGFAAVLLIFILVRSSKVGLMSALLLVVSGSLLSSAASGYCPLYTQLGITTNTDA